MSSDTKPTPPKNAVYWVLFASALDFPGQQESNITFADKPKETGPSYMATLHPERASIEIRMFRNGQPVVDDTSKRAIVRSVPLAQIKQYEMV